MRATKQTLKRSDLLVTAVRFLKAIRQTWTRTAVDVRDGRRMRAMLDDRQERLYDYLTFGPDVRKLQIGSGDNRLENWLNTDLEPTSIDVIHLNALDAFPFDDSTFDYVFSEHMIEHITYKDAMFMLGEVFRVLRPGGKVRIATPDVEKIAGLLTDVKTDAQRRYIEWSALDSLGLYSYDKSRLQQHRYEWDIERGHFEQYYPDIANDCTCFIVNNFFRSYGHQFLHNETTLSGVLRSAGFVDVTPCHPGESDDPNLRDIETHHRLIGEEMNCFETMVLEARRP